MEAKMESIKIFGDYLSRTQTITDIVSIVKSCIETKKPTTFSIEGEWGKGKTWTVEQIGNMLEGYDLTLSKNNSKIKKENKEFLVFRYNAWEKDYYDEPLLAILITIINQLNKHLVLDNIIKGELTALYEITKEIMEVSLKAISTRLIGIDVVDYGKRGIRIFKKSKKAAKIKTEADYSENNIEKDINTVVKQLNKLSQEIPIVFIVDELDRCLPEHAIKTLERLHHIFGKVISSVTIISVNEAQLKTTVQKMFGNEIPFESYLRKFVDFRIALDSGNVNIEELRNKLNVFFSLFDEVGDENFCNELIENLCSHMTPRDFEKVCNNAMLCHSLVGKETKKFNKDYAVGELLLFACKIAIEKEKNHANLNPLYSNNTDSKLGKFIKKLLQEIPRRALVRLANSNERICYVCIKGLLTPKEFEAEYGFNITMDMADLETFYDEYVRYYRLIK